MTWFAVGSAAVSLVGGFLNKKAGDKAAQTSQQMSEADRKFYEHMYDKSLGDNRASQQNDFGSLTWAQDPTTGKWTQQVHMDPASKARLEDYRQIAADRMADAKGGYHTDWNSLGFGKVAHAVLGQEGDTGRVHGSGVGQGYHTGDMNSAYPAGGGNIFHHGTEIAPNYKPDSQFSPTATDTAPTPRATPPGVQVDPILQAQAEALRQQAANGWMGGN